MITTQNNNYKCNSSFLPSDAQNLNHTSLSLSLNKKGQGILSHLWYKLLNSSVTGMLFKSSELALQAHCSVRTVYTALRGMVSRGEITVQNKGCDGLLITMLKKGWQLTKSFIKTAFLAYFRDRGLIPYIYTTPNTSPSGGGGNNTTDRIGKMCAKEGLSEAQTRAVKEKVKKVDNIKSLGGLVKYFINQIKEGLLMALQSGHDIEARRKALESLRRKADLDARVELELKGIVEPKPTGGFMTIEELDDMSTYHSLHSTTSVMLYNKLCAEAGYSK